MNLSKTIRISSQTLTIAQSKLFTYPNRLVNPHKASIMEINLPEDRIDDHQIELSTIQGSTRSLAFEVKSGVEKKGSLRTNLKDIYQTISKSRRSPLSVGKGLIFDARYDTDRNISHILSNIVTILFALKEMDHRVTVLLREKASSMSRTVYNLLGFPVLFTDGDVCGEVVVGSVDTAYLRDWRTGRYGLHFGDLDFEGFKHQTPERIFISRKGTRCLTNEQEIEQTLREYGFKKFYFEDIPISEQWSLAKNAKVIVGIHGAAFTSILFNRNSPKVLELFHPGYLSPTYRRMTNAIGGTWCGVTGQFPVNLIRELEMKKQGRYFASANMRIAPSSLQEALQYLGVGMKKY